MKPSNCSIKSERKLKFSESKETRKQLKENSRKLVLIYLASMQKYLFLYKLFAKLNGFRSQMAIRVNYLTQLIMKLCLGFYISNER